MHSLKACALTIQSLLHGDNFIGESGHPNDESVLKSVLRVVEHSDQAIFPTFLDQCRNNICRPEHRWYVSVLYLISNLLLGCRVLCMPYCMFVNEILKRTRTNNN